MIKLKFIKNKNTSGAIKKANQAYNNKDEKLTETKLKSGSKLAVTPPKYLGLVRPWLLSTNLVKDLKLVAKANFKSKI